jgi:hypothetical protein
MNENMTDNGIGIFGLILVLNLFRQGYFIIRRLFVREPTGQSYTAHGMFHRLSARDAAAHSTVIDRETESHSRRHLLGIGCKGDFVDLAEVEPRA